MRKIGRILFGAGIGCAIATAVLVVLIFITESLLYPHGVRYDDLTLAYVSWGLLVSAPIIGGWWAWVRS